MKLAIITTSDTGKRTVSTGNEYIDIDITAGNRTIARLTVREGDNGAAVFDEQDQNIARVQCAICGKICQSGISCCVPL